VQQREGGRGEVGVVQGIGDVVGAARAGHGRVDVGREEDKGEGAGSSLRCCTFERTYLKYDDRERPATRSLISNSARAGRRRVARLRGYRGLRPVPVPVVPVPVTRAGWETRAIP
jgi:hypothetical protein